LPDTSDPRRRHASKTGRTVAIRYGEAVTTHALAAMFWQVIAQPLGGRLARAQSGKQTSGD
jgi:hypothetical protein